jgi:hypothetical protein
MKKCKICLQPNPRRFSTCSYECEKELARRKDLEKREKALLRKENKLKGLTAKVEIKSKAKTISQLKDKAWNLFSRYIRLKYADKSGYVKCVTCGTIKHYKEMQAGHAVAGRGGFVLFLLKIIRPQCKGCNVYAGGRYDRFAEYLIDQEKSLTWEEYGEIVRQSQLPHKWNIQRLEYIIAEYSEKLKQLEIKSCNND